MVLIEILPGPPAVYLPWVEFGLRGLSEALMLERAESYLALVMGKLGR